MQQDASSKQKGSDFLGTEPVGRLLARLAVPTVAAQMINMLYNIVDRIYIGHIPGDGALALTGLGVCMPLIMIVSAFAALVSSGGAPRASIFLGRGDAASAEKTLGNCFAVQVGVSALLTAILLAFGRGLLLAFGASENTIGYAASYMNIYALGTVFVQLTLGMNAFITAQGFAKTGMLSVLIGAVCNILLDPVFIFAFGMGVQGAALATVLSQAASCCWVLSFLLGKKTLLRLRPACMRLERRILLPALALGLAAFIMQASESILSVCFNSSLLRYGGDLAVGAMTILTSVMQFAMLPLQGLGQGAQPRPGQTGLLGAFAGKPYLFRPAVGPGDALSRGVCGHVYQRRRAAGVQQPGAAHLSGGAGAFWHPDRLPAYLYRSGQRQGVHYGGGHAQVCAADPAHLPAARPAAGRQGHLGLPGRAGGRPAGRKLYGGAVQLPV